MKKMFSADTPFYKHLGFSPAMALGLLGACAVAFWLYASETDKLITAYFMEHVHADWQQDIFGYLSRMGQAWFQVIVCLILGFWYYRKGMLSHSRAWYLSIPIFFITGIAGYVLKVVFGRPRPKMLEHGMYDFHWFEFASRMHAFPSGHTLTTFSLLATVAFLYPRYGQALLWLAAIIISMGRVGIGSHWMGDVVFGAVIGYCVGCYFKRKWKLERPEHVFDAQ